MDHHEHKVTNLNRHDHSSSPQRPNKRRRSSDVQGDDRDVRNHKSSVSYRPSFSSSSNENGSSNKRRREYLSRFEIPNDMKDHHRSCKASSYYHRKKISYENKASEHEEEEEERHFKRRPSWSSSIRPEIVIA